MKLSARTITAIGRVVTGDEGLTRYRTGPELVQLFNEFGCNSVYGRGFPSRWQFAEDRLRELNGSEAIGALIRQILDPREFLDGDLKVENAIEYVNKRLSYDGFEVAIHAGVAKIRDLDGANVECRHPFDGSTDDGHLFIDEQIQKAERKIQEGDYDGAITNARSLLEAVLVDLEASNGENVIAYDGDLPKLYRRVGKYLNLDPANPELDNPFKQVLSGLISVVTGLSGLSNKLGDRHARTYKPAKHHAVLVVNASKTLANFLFATHAYRAEKDR